MDKVIFVREFWECQPGWRRRGSNCNVTEKNQQPSGNGCSNEEFPPEMLILPVGFSLIVAIYIYIYFYACRRVDAPLRGHVCAADSGARDRRAHERKH